jgi:hypothetical protein
LKRLVIINIVVLILICCPQLHSQANDDLLRIEKPTSGVKMKSGFEGVFYSLFPGFMVHGCGHMYAGEHGTGFLLFGIETVGAMMMLFSGLSTTIDYTSDNDPPPMNCGLGNNYQNESIFIAGAVMFFGSWIYDIIGTPFAVKKFNRQMKANHIGVSLDLKKINNSRALFLKFSYNF